MPVGILADESQNCICDCCGNIFLRKGSSKVVSCPSCGTRHRWVNAEAVDVIRKGSMGLDKMRRLLAKAKTMSRAREDPAGSERRAAKTREQQEADEMLVAAYTAMSMDDFDDEDWSDVSFDDVFVPPDPPPDGPSWDPVPAVPQDPEPGQGRDDSDLAYSIDACDHMAVPSGQPDGSTRSRLLSRRPTIHQGILAYVEKKVR